MHGAALGGRELLALAVWCGGWQSPQGPGDLQQKFDNSPTLCFYGSKFTNDRQGMMKGYLECLSLNFRSTIKGDNWVCSLKPGVTWGLGRAWKDGSCSCVGRAPRHMGE